MSKMAHKHDHVLGKWNLVSEDQFFELLSKTGSTAVKDGYSITYEKVDGPEGAYAQTISWKGDSDEEYFVSGKEHSFQRGDATVKVKITIDGKKLEQVETVIQESGEESGFTTVREFSGRCMTTKLTASGQEEGTVGVAEFRRECVLGCALL